MAFPTAASAELLSFLNTQNSRAALDVGTRAIVHNEVSGSIMVAGVDTHRVFSRPGGDFATLTVQPYLIVADPPPVQRDDTPVERRKEVFVDWRSTNLNLKVAPLGRANLRIGHFEVPFGLEQVIQTAGTLHDMNARFNSGRKTDWGTSVNGLVSNVEYEFAWMTGPGSSAGFFTGRIGRSRDNDWWFGLSGLKGDTNTPSKVTSETVERSRWGIDGGIYLGSGLHFLTDIATGRDNGERATHALLESGYRNRRETQLTYLQLRLGRIKTATDTMNADSVTLGFRYEPGQRLTTSFEYRHSLQNGLEPSQFTAQLRLRI